LARLLRFTPRYLKDAHSAGVLPNPQALRAVRHVLRLLEDAAELPLAGDQYTFVPPERGSDPSALVHVLAHVRRVKGRNLWVWYREKLGAVELLALTDVPPA
jgi:hypothetical protein